MSSYSTSKIINRESISDFLFLVGLLAFGIFFAAFTVTHISVYANISSDNLSQYHGSYEIYERRRHRAVTYIFKLENGDIVAVKPSLMQDFKKNELPETLSFSYSKKKDFIQSAYTAVSVQSETGAVFLTANTSRTEAQLGICVGAVCCILCLALLALSVMSLPRKRSARRRKKKAIKHKKT